MRVIKGKMRKLNNQGMSLVEVLVAMAIISIAGVAFLQSFVNSANYNARAREKQYALYLAQSIMEDFKAYSIEDMKDRFGGGGTSFDQYTVEDLEIASSGVMMLKGVTFNTRKYDVSIAVTSSANAVAVASAGVIVEAPNPYVDILGGAGKDAYFREPLEGVEYALQDAVYKKLCELAYKEDAAGGLKYPGLKEYLDTVDYSVIPSSGIKINDRVIYYTLSNSVGSSGAAAVQMDVKEQIIVDLEPIKYTVYDEETETETEETIEGVAGFATVNLPDDFNDDLDPGAEYRNAYTCYQNAAPPVDGNYRLFSYFYPSYAIFGQSNITSSDFSKDRIFVTNSLSDNMDLFLIKQNVIDSIPALSSNEKDYSAFVINCGGSCNLYTNMNDIFEAGVNGTGYKKRTGLVGFDDTLGYSTYQYEKGRLFCFNFGSGFNKDDATAGVWYNNADESEVLLNNIEITVSRDGEELYVLDGSANIK